MVPAFDLGLPYDSTDPLYGLWEPVTSRFLFVVGELEYAETLRLAASARYSLFVTKISCAENYYYNIIDNSCCNQWSMSNSQDVFTSQPGKFLKPVSVVKLIPCTEYEQWELDREMEYLQICLWWIKFVNSNKQVGWYEFDRFIARIYSELEFDTKHNLFDTIYRLETQLLRCLHQYRNNHDVWENCMSLINQSLPILKTRYQLFLHNHLKGSV